MMNQSNATINKKSLYKALTATERLSLYKKHNFISGDFMPFQNWINTRGVITEADIYNMLNICNITAEDFNLAIKALSQHEIEQIAMTDDAGEWYKQFDEIVAEYFDGLFQEKISDLNNDSTPIDLSMSIAPFILYFKKKIDLILGGLKHATLSQDAFKKMIQKFSSVLVSLSIKTLVWELHCFSQNLDTKKKDTNTADRKFKLFISNTFFEKESFSGFYYKYPVIARRLIVKCEHIITHFSEMLIRFDDNFHAILDALKIEDIPTEITDIDCDQGDTHQQGRFVVKIHLNNLIILYKPRNLMVQKIFYEIIDYFNENTVLLDMYVHKAFYGDNYTFDSYVEYRECSNEIQVNRYYGRFGQLCSLIWVLCGNDIHYENIIAYSEYPVIIDVETLFQHQSSILNMPKSAIYKAYSECIDSVGGTAMIPIVTHSKGDKQRGVDISALAGDEQVLPFQILALKDINTDSMHYEYSDVTMQGAKNIPMLMDNKVNFFDYVEKILDGFNFSVRFIQEHKSEFIRLIHKFDDIVVRQLMKSTINYAKLMDFSSHPNYSQDMIKLERMFHNAWSYNYKDKRIIAAEVSDMLFGDIPLFYNKVDSRDIITSSGEIIKDYFDSPALDKAIDRVQTLSDSEILKQLAQIKICLGLYLVENDEKSAQREEKTYIPTAIDDFGEDREILLLKAKEIADEIGRAHV